MQLPWKVASEAGLTVLIILNIALRFFKENLKDNDLVEKHLSLHRFYGILNIEIESIWHVHYRVILDK